jgi:DNA polymerase-1
MFFGMPSRIIGKSGQQIQGIVGFVGAVNRLIDMTNASNVAVFFDSATENPRKALLEEYKENRPDWTEVADEDNPFTQLPYIYKALDFMGICHAEIKGAETDDVIASYALTKSKDADIFISSFDSDYFQLISDSVKVIRYKGKCSVFIDTAFVSERLGICPCLYPDFKSLVGDTADNIKGIHGIGPKTASKLICAYGSIENMLSDTSVIKEEKLRTLLEENADLLRRNLCLIKLDSHAPMPFSLDELEFSAPRIRTMAIIDAIGI